MCVMWHTRLYNRRTEVSYILDQSIYFSVQYYFVLFTITVSSYILYQGNVIFREKIIFYLLLLTDIINVTFILLLLSLLLNGSSNPQCMFQL